MGYRVMLARGSVKIFCAELRIYHSRNRENDDIVAKMVRLQGSVCHGTADIANGHSSDCTAGRASVACMRRSVIQVKKPVIRFAPYGLLFPLCGLYTAL